MHSKNAKSGIIFYFLNFSLNFTQIPCPKYFQTSKYILIECSHISLCRFHKQTLWVHTHTFVCQPMLATSPYLTMTCCTFTLAFSKNIQCHMICTVFATYTFWFTCILKNNICTLMCRRSSNAALLWSTTHATLCSQPTISHPKQTLVFQTVFT